MKTLDVLGINNVLTIDGKEYTIRFSATLHDLVQRNGSKEWEKSGKTYSAFCIGKDWVMSLPTKEGGKKEWFRLQVKEEGSTLGGFFLGTSEAPGPARQFARTKERGQVEYDMFGEKWQITDIGAFDIESDGNSDLIKRNDRLYYIISLNERIFLYLDARPKEAKGIGASFVGKKFNPETDIESIL